MCIRVHVFVHLYIFFRVGCGDGFAQRAFKPVAIVDPTVTLAASCKVSDERVRRRRYDICGHPSHLWSDAILARTRIWTSICFVTFARTRIYLQMCGGIKGPNDHMCVFVDG